MQKLASIVLCQKNRILKIMNKRETLSLAAGWGGEGTHTYSRIAFNFSKNKNILK